MSKYELYLSIHLLAIVIWLGGGLTVNILLTRIFNTGDMNAYATAAVNVGWIGQRLYTGASVVALVTGLLLTSELDVNVYEPWVLFGLLVLIASAVVGATVLGPTAEKTGELLASAAGPEAVREQFTKLVTINRVELLLLFLVVVDMAVKPGWP